MRTCWPASSRSLGSARLPFTRTSPLRMMRWIWLNEGPGKRASKKRSTRMPASSPVTVTVWTPVTTSGSGAGSGFGAGGASRRGRDSNGGGSRGGRDSKAGRSRDLRASKLFFGPSWPRPAHRCASAALQPSAAFRPGGRTRLSACDLRKARAACPALQRRICARLARFEATRLGIPRTKTSPSACAIRMRAVRHARLPVRHHGACRHREPIPCRSCGPHRLCGRRRAGVRRVSLWASFHLGVLAIPRDGETIALHGQCDRMFGHQTAAR